MSEIEIISWALIALFVLTVVSTLVGWLFIRKYEKLKLDFTTQKLEEFAESLDDFLTENNSIVHSYFEKAGNMDMEFHKKRISGFKSFLQEMEQDYSKYTNKVEKLNIQFAQLNKDLEFRNNELSAINPELIKTNNLLREEDLKIKNLIDNLFQILTETRTQFDARFKELNTDFNNETEKTHTTYRDKIKEYSSELIIAIQQLQKNLTTSQTEVVKNYKEELLEHASDAELSLKKAIKNHSFIKIEEQLNQTIQNQLDAKNKIIELETKMENILGEQTNLMAAVKETQNTIEILSKNKSLFKKLF